MVTGAECALHRVSQRLAARVTYLVLTERLPALCSFPSTFPSSGPRQSHPSRSARPVPRSQKRFHRLPDRVWPRAGNGIPFSSQSQSAVLGQLYFCHQRG